MRAWNWRPGPASAGSGSLLALLLPAGRIVRRRARGRSRRHALSPLRRRRRDDSRPLGAGAQEARREVRDQRQLLHGHGHERFHRRGSLGRERIQGRARPVQPRPRVPARQDDLQPRLHQQQRERLPGRDHLVRHQPGPVRRPDDDQHGLLARQGRRAPSRHDHRPDRSDVQGADRPLELSRRRVADPDQEHHQLAAAGSDHRRGLPQQSVSLVPVRQSER